MMTVEEPRRRLPADIEAEILLRLPVKTLIRFKIACKPWSSLISSPQFQKSHHHHSQHDPLLLTLHSEENVNVESDPGDKTLRYNNYAGPEAGFVIHLAAFSKLIPNEFYNRDMLNLRFSKLIPNEFYNRDMLNLRFSAFSTKPKLTLVNNFSKTLQQPMFDNSMCGKPYMQSCMGLVCIASWSWTIPPILVCNPSTRDLISLPPTKEYNVRVGFRDVPSTHQFKVVRFFSEGNKKKSRCQVFTLGTTHWREAPSAPYRVCDGLAPFLHGAVHCLPETSPRGVQSTDVIVAFNIDTEEYGKIIPLPAFYHSLGKDLNTTRKRLGIVDIKNFMRLTILGGSLCLTFDFGEHKCRLELWILKDYNNAQWVKGYTIDVSSVYPYPSFSFWAYPTDNTVDEGILLNCSGERGVKLLGYNPESGTVKVNKVKEWAATFYEETLYSLRS